MLTSAAKSVQTCIQDAWREDAAAPSEAPLASEQADVRAVDKSTKIKAEKDQVAAANFMNKDQEVEEHASIAARLQGTQCYMLYVCLGSCQIQRPGANQRHLADNHA